MYFLLTSALRKKNVKVFIQIHKFLKKIVVFKFSDDAMFTECLVFIHIDKF